MRSTARRVVPFTRWTLQVQVTSDRLEPIAQAEDARLRGFLAVVSRAVIDDLYRERPVLGSQLDDGAVRGGVLHSRGLLVRDGRAKTRSASPRNYQVY
jgi:hypothetical protein